MNDVHVLTDSSIHLLPEVDVSAEKRYVLVRGCTIAPQNNLLPPVCGLMYGGLLRDTYVVAINDAMLRTNAKE